MAEPLTPGLLVLHGNRLELLAEAVFTWLGRHPLAPLEEETFLVHSHGMAEWLKMELAGAHGICAATRLELPARFVWRAYRAVLGRAAVPAVAPLDKLPLTWQLMQQLPQLLADADAGAVYAPVAGFLRRGNGHGGDPGRAGGDDAARRLQLARRLADLFDQYQVYRADWLHDWQQGRDVLRDAAGHATPVPPEQLWQPALWRALVAALPPAQREATRVDLHRRLLQALAGPAPAGSWPGLPRRLVLFGSSHLPHQLLEAVAALAAHVQVLVAVPNPCRFHWADLIDGRELLRAQRRRHALRGGIDLATVPPAALHAHGHPLLAAWGRQARDGVRQLDAFDDAPAAQARFGLPRVDLFDGGDDAADGLPLLQQVQAAIRELRPLAEHPAPQGRPGVPADDRSIVFHVAHGPQREVEILHDQLLHLLAHPPGEGPLAPRDIVVMVPDIETFAPAIRAVFGQHAPGQPRHIPWGIADLRERGRHPITVALEWLLGVPLRRFGASEVRDLLDVPALARRFDIAPEDLPQLAAWVEGAGIRWGLHAAHRASLGLAAAGEDSTWAFGLRRMLLGYATGELPQADGVAGIEPQAEVTGLAAGLAGQLAELMQVLEAWWRDARTPRPPAAWAERLRRLLQELFRAADDAERAQLGALDEGLSSWLQACEAAGFDEPLALDVVREAWLDAVDEPTLGRRFKAGGVTFCTLLPLRAIPFEVVCLLGLNDGDYPRRAPRSDFDLLALPGQARPGDRSRRDDDLQLMLDALLSARRVLYVSWAGRSLRDLGEQPPSVLVAQLRDYLAAGWGEGVLAPRTTEHPLQPFSRRYFERGAAPTPDAADTAARLFTYAAEWRAAHAPAGGASAVSPWRAGQGPAAVTPSEPAAGLTLDIRTLADFLRNPVKAFFRHRLQATLDSHEAEADDDERFALQGLDGWGANDELLQAVQRALQEAPAEPASDALRGPGAAADDTAAPALEALLAREAARLRRRGRLPLAGPGDAAQAALVDELRPLLARAQAARASHPQVLEPLTLRIADPQDAGLVFEDVLAGLRGAPEGGLPLWVNLGASRLVDIETKNGSIRLKGPRTHKLLQAWVTVLAASACGRPVEGLLIGERALVRLVDPPPPAEAAAQLLALMRAAREGLAGDQPWPTAVRTGLAWLEDPDKAVTAYEGSEWQPRNAGPRPEGDEPHLARLFPDFETLAADPAFEDVTRRLYAPYRAWLDQKVKLQALSADPPEAADG